MEIENKEILDKNCCDDNCCKDGCCKDDCCKKYKHGHIHGGSEAVYCLGIIGAAIYFIGHAATFWLGVLGFLKAMVWPVFIIYKILEFFKM